MKHTAQKQGIPSPRSILAVGAHPDDLEVGCFGTLLKHKSAGDKVTVAITTKGGYGNRTWEQISREAKNASKVLGVDYIILDNKIGHYEMNWKTVGEIDQIISKKCSGYGLYSVARGQPPGPSADIQERVGGLQDQEDKEPVLLRDVGIQLQVAVDL